MKNKIDRQLVDGAQHFRRAYGSRAYLRRAATLGQDAQLVLCMFEENLPVDEVLDELAARVHRGPGRTTAADLSRAVLAFLVAVHAIRVAFEIETDEASR